MEFLQTLLQMTKMQMKRKVFKHKFVEFIPEVIKEGILYISVPYATATHKCACGCGEIVVTPIKPADWKLTWDGETVTMYPSIGNWNFPCKSHYWIEESKIIWAREWSDSEIKKGRIKDRAIKNRYYGKFQK